MTMNKKLILSALACLAVLPIAVLALVFPDQPTGATPWNILNVISITVGLVWWVFVGIVVIMFIVAGVMFLIAKGDPAGVEKARQAVIWGTAGVVVAIAGYGLIRTMQLLFF